MNIFPNGLMNDQPLEARLNTDGNKDINQADYLAKQAEVKPPKKAKELLASVHYVPSVHYGCNSINQI